MKLIKCPKCGEMYSDSYRTCPFCQEDEALKGRAAAPRRKVTRRRRAPSILGPAMVLVVVLAAVLVGVLLFGGKGNAEKPDDPAVVEPDPAPATPLTKEKLGLRSIYQDKGETINEFSAKVGSTVQMRVDGTEQTVTWTIEDTKIATVDANGLVTAVAKGKTILKATVGDQSVSCFVIVN